MPEPISKAEIERIEKAGGKVNLMAKIIAVPGLEAIAKHFHDIKHEQAEAYQAAMAATLTKMDETIAAIGPPPETPGLVAPSNTLSQAKTLPHSQ